MCNLYNKNRSDKKISEAICANGVKEETDLFYATDDFLTLGFIKVDNNKEFLEEQTDFCLELMNNPKRYSFSLPYLIYISRKHSFNFKFKSTEDFTVNLEDMLSTNSSARLSCTKPKRERKLERNSLKFKYTSDYSCTNLVSEMTRRFNYKLDAPINPVTLAYEVLSDSKNREFIHRIVSKDQKGHREISILNYDMRVMAFFAETMGRNTVGLDGNLVESKEKWKIFENLVVKSRMYAKDKGMAFLNHNIDHSRWGPNNLMNAFYAVFAPKIEDKELRRLIKNSFIAGTLKKAQLPESLTEFVSSRLNVGKSEDITKFVLNFEKNIKSGDFLVETPQGMCQGIYHNCSSVYATVVADHVNYLLMKSGYVDYAKSLCTSDDEYKAIVLHYSNTNIDIITSIEDKVKALCNLVKSKPKSCLTGFSSELNSLHINSNETVIANFKQRASYVTFGDSNNFENDIESAIDKGVDLLMLGGSLFGSKLLSFANLTNVYDKWAVWKNADFNDKDPTSLGFPVVNILCAAMFGTKKSLILNNITDDNFATIILNGDLKVSNSISFSERNYKMINAFTGFILVFYK